MSYRTKLGLVVFLSKEDQMSWQVDEVTKALRTVSLPPPDFIEGHNGRRIGRRRLLQKIKDSPRTVVLPAERFLERFVGFRWFGPGQDDFPINAHLLSWIRQNASPMQGHLVLVHHLPPLPKGMCPTDVKLNVIAYSIGRWIIDTSTFISFFYEGNSYLLKNRTGDVGLVS